MNETNETNEAIFDINAAIESANMAFENWAKDPWKYAEKHRRGISDMDWAAQQPKSQNYFIGDIVEFFVGGFGIIDEVSKAHGGWPPKYSTQKVEGYPYRSDGKVAWHYEGDVKALVQPSTLRNLALTPKAEPVDSSSAPILQAARSESSTK
jgi:hypothetical protein